MSTVGENIKRIRKAKGLTQKELGKKLGISQAEIAQRETGRRNPKIETVQKIADALQVPVSEIYGWDNLPKCNLNDIGRRIAFYRKQCGYSQRELAEKLEIATVTLQQYELLKRNPNRAMIQRIAKILNIKEPELYGFDCDELRHDLTKIFMAKSILKNAIDSDSYSVMHKAILESYTILNGLCDLSVEVKR